MSSSSPHRTLERTPKPGARVSAKTIVTDISGAELFDVAPMP
jgi:hypothetical protein